MSFLSKLKLHRSGSPGSPLGEPAEYESEREICGLFELSSPPSGQMCKVDIVAVHGLMGDWIKTWTDENGQFWLRDFLPSQVPAARVFSYGYDSRVAFTKSVTNINDEAAMLLDRIDGERRFDDEKGRPIIFISHSLGGIIVKKAMVLAHTRARYANLLKHIRGALFLAVPHRGADIAFWGTFAASLLRKAQLGLGTNTEFLDNLQRNSPEFAQISQDFVERGATLHIRSFYETVMMGNQLIVDRDSAILRLPNELAVGIAGANHVNICKFGSAVSQKYRPVKRAVDELVEKSAAAVEPIYFAATPSLQSIPIPADKRGYMPFQRNLRFTGRVQIFEEINAHFRTNPKKAFVLTGMGGIGKTSIALEYAHRLQDLDRMVMWVDATSDQSLTASFDKILSGLKRDNQNSDEDCRTMVIKKLEARRDWVMIFDNADDESISYGDWVPRHGHVLFTTRDERLAYRIVADQKEMPLMDDDEASELFMARGSGTSQAGTVPNPLVNKLVQRLGKLPLAVTLASAYLREYKSIALDTYLQSLNDLYDRKELLSYKEPFSNYNHSVCSVWEISFEKVQRDNPRAASILLLLGFLANNSVTREFLTASYHPRTSRGYIKILSLHRAEVAEDLQFLDSFLGLEQAIGLLKSLSLIDDDGLRISLHPLVHEWTQMRLSLIEAAHWGCLALLVLFGRYVSYQYPEAGRSLDPDFWDHLDVIRTGLGKSQEQLALVHYECYLLILTVLVATGTPTPDLSTEKSQPVTRKWFVSLRAKHHQDLPPSYTYFWTGLAISLLKAIPPQYREIMMCCTRLARDLSELKQWLSHAEEIRNESDEIAPVDVARRSEDFRLNFTKRVRSVIGSLQELYIINPPEEVAEVSSIWISQAAENFGKNIPFWLLKPTFECRVQLFYEAHSLGRWIHSIAGKSLALKGAISFARYVDTQVSNVSAWQKVEECLVQGLETAKETMRWLEFTTYLDYLCQSLWESDHEDALYGLVNLAREIDKHTTEKWRVRLQSRWKELHRSPVAFSKLSEKERGIVDALIANLIKSNRRLNAAHFPT